MKPFLISRHDVKKLTPILITIAVLLALLLMSQVFKHRHSFGEWTHSSDPTCLAEGIMIRYCDCGQTQTRRIDRLPHTEGEYEFSLSGNELIRKLLCSVCGSAISVESLGEHTHELGSWSTELDTTCTSNGLRSRSCMCGYVEEAIIASPGHSFGEWIETQAASCNISGEQIRTCHCGETDTSAIPALEHEEDAWTIVANEKHFPCKHCKDILRIEELKASEGLVIVDGVVVSVGNCSDEEIVIPSVVDGIKVYAIGDKAFYECYTVKRIYMPDSIESIGSKAFWDCRNLELINIPHGVTTIGNSAFAYCEKLASISLPASLVSLNMWTFNCCTGLSEINFDGTVEEWHAIPKNEAWDEDTGSYRIICTDGAVEK